MASSEDQLLLLKACAHRGLISRAEATFQEMYDHGCELTLTIYNCMIHTCTQVGDLEKAEYYMNMAEGDGLKPDLVSYNMVINACAAAGAAARAEKWLQWIQHSRGMTPNEVTYGTICKAFAREGDVESVERIMSACETSGCTLNEYFFASLISACGACRPPNPPRAELAFAELVRRGLPAQRVKKALGRVVGDKRAAQLIDQAAKSGLASVETQTAGSRPQGCRSNTPASNTKQRPQQKCQRKYSSNDSQHRQQDNYTTTMPAVQDSIAVDTPLPSLLTSLLSRPVSAATKCGEPWMQQGEQCMQWNNGYGKRCGLGLDTPLPTLLTRSPPGLHADVCDIEKVMPPTCPTLLTKSPPGLFADDFAAEKVVMMAMEVETGSAALVAPPGLDGTQDAFQVYQPGLLLRSFAMI